LVRACRGTLKILVPSSSQKEKSSQAPIALDAQLGLVLPAGVRSHLILLKEKRFRSLEADCFIYFYIFYFSVLTRARIEPGGQQDFLKEIL
jgi:hypothetical protein